MKYTHLFTGLLIGLAVGGGVVATTGIGKSASSAGSMSEDNVKKIVRQVISDEPELIVDSVQKMQEEQMGKRTADASAALKDKVVHDAVYDDKGVGSVGPKDSKRVMVEFFDYNCPACKMQYKEIDKLVKKDSGVRVIFREFPIFGPVSEQNSRYGLAVARIAPEKYFDFYEKMHANTGRSSEADVFKFVKELGIDVEKLKEEAKKPEINQELEKNRELGEKLHIQGTPTLVVGDEVIPHAAEADELISKLK